MKKIRDITHCFICTLVNRPKESGLSALLVLFVAFAVYKSTPPFVDKVFELKIYKNGQIIHKLDDERNISGEKTVWVDKLMLKDGYRLMHPKLGAFAFSEHFFIDVNGEFEVKVPGRYYLYPGSDDGFALSVDGKQLCQFLGSRPYATRACPVELDKGTHTFELNYYQGSGHAGLTLAYRHKEDKKRRWFGENSRYLKFH